MADTEDAKARGYAAIWESGWLTDDAYVNARIWRAVTVALDTAFEPAEHNGPHFA